MMPKTPQGPKEYDLVDLKATVPDQGRWVKVIEKPLPPLSRLPGTKDFTPIRLIGNIAVVDYDDPNVVLTTFDPPIELSAVYHDMDLFEAARSNRRLKLGYWNGKRWVVFTTSQHGYLLMPPTRGGRGKAKIARWAGDPPIAWGV
jgi:hypothetical protein